MSSVKESATAYAPSTAGEADQIAYQDIMSTWPRLGLAIFHSRTTRGGILRFDNRPWLVDIYKDDSRKVVIKKASQLGLSDFAINATFAHARDGRAVLYVLPRDKDVYDFTPRRIDRLINRSEYYLANCAQGRKASDTKSQKTLFGTDCHFVGSQASTNFYEKPCDVLALDEFDKLDQESLPYAFDRLASSPDPHWYKFGNPTRKGSGIDREYDLSDRKVWMIPCEHCGEKQSLGWFTHCVDECEGGYRLKHQDAPVCIKCGRPVNRLARGEWVAEFKDREISGYDVSTIFGNPRPGIIADMLAEFNEARGNPSAIQRFYNNVLGMPYTGSGTSLTYEILSACASEMTVQDMQKLEGVVVGGADVGSRIHLHISKIHNGKRHKMFCGFARDFADLSRISSLYGVQRGVVDALPEGHAVAEFLRDNPRWYRCFYNLEASNKAQMDIDHASQTVRVNRTASIDESYAEWMRGQVVLPANWQGLDGGDFLAHMTAPAREYVEHKTDSSKNKFEWREHDKPDHHFHADNYDRIAKDLYGYGSNLITVV